MLQIGIVIFSTIAGIAAAIVFGSNGFGVRLAVTSFFVVMIVGSVSGLLGLNWVCERWYGKHDGLLSADPTEALNRVGLTTGEIGTVLGVPAFVTGLAFYAVPSTTGAIGVVIAAFGLLWTAALILGQYRLRRMKRR